LDNDDAIDNGKGNGTGSGTLNDTENDKGIGTDNGNGAAWWVG
jgi:hypothetical protein